MRRANAMSDHFKDVQILTLEYQRNHHELIRRVRYHKELNHKVTVKSLYIELDPYKNQTPPEDKIAKSHIEEDGLTAVKDKENHAYHYYRDGNYVKYKILDWKDRVTHIDYFNGDQVRVRREDYDDNGYLVRIQEIDAKTNQAYVYRYISKNGTCFLSTWVNLKTKKIGRCELHYPKTKAFDTVVDLYTYWVTNEIKQMRNPVLMSDSRGLPTDKVLLNIPSNQAGRVAISHNNHFKKPYRKGSGYSSAWDTLLNNIHQFDRVVLLTEEQRNDLIEDFGHFDHLTVIPHEAKAIPNDYPDVSVDPYLAVALVRYKDQKRVDEAIRAFVHVVQKIPEAKFDIYGSGPLKQELQNLINELGMEKHIELKGYTNDPIACYKKAACTVLSSDFEGSPLVFNESLAAGTPIVTYDFKYGARDVIRDGVDGFVVPRGDQVALADRIIAIMQNPELREDMSKRALEITQRFSYERYVNNWVTLFQDVARRQKQSKLTSVFSKLFKTS